MEGQLWTKLLSLLDIDFLGYEKLQINDAFSKFYETTNSNPHKEWLEETLEDLPKKSNSKAETLRDIGNKQHVKGNFNEGIKWYTMSLHFAIFNSVDYGKALSNRSAGSFALEKYEECLKDIEACFASEYPNELRSKVLLRRLQCYYHLKMDDKFYSAVEEMREQFNDNEAFNNCINNYPSNTINPIILEKTDFVEVDDINLKSNVMFAYALDLIDLRYDAVKGRHVVAATDIEPGGILFKEEAFVAAQIFKSREELVPEVCYNCLKHIPYFSLPCPSCTYCLYCSEDCKEISWNQSHRFECPGIIIFYELGQALPAFKCLMKGISTGFQEADNTLTKFGSVDNNYQYANSLVCHFDTRSESNKMHLLGVALIVVLYLKNKTNFFDYLKENFNINDKKRLPGFQPESDKYLELVTGQMLVKHMVQLFCNGSIVERKTDAKMYPIAAAIYPSISMMNHSCKANITIEYNGSIAIVKAVDAILEGEEVFNSYGVDYTTDKDIRQEYLKENYGFECFCPVCI